MSPDGATDTAAPAGLGVLNLHSQGFRCAAPLAINARPVGAKTWPDPSVILRRGDQAVVRRQEQADRVQRCGRVEEADGPVGHEDVRAAAVEAVDVLAVAAVDGARAG